MSQAPAMPMYWDAYLADTTHLTTEEHGAYLLLLAAMWRRNGTVPDNDADNARILGLTKAKWRKIKARLSDLLTIQDGVISQKKLQKTWKKTQEKIQTNRANGAKGGRPKSSENKDMAKADGSVSDSRTLTLPEPEPEIDTNVSIPPVVPQDPAPISEAAQAVEEYNQAAESVGWPKVQKITKPRISAINARLAECGGLEGWRVALAKARASPFLTGDNDRGWRADFDFLTKAQKFTQLMEGKYDRTDRKSSHPDPEAHIVDAACRLAEASRADRERGQGDPFQLLAVEGGGSRRGRGPFDVD